MNISIATSIKYGAYKYWLSYTTQLALMLEEYEDSIRAHINLPPEVLIILRPIPANLGTATVMTLKNSLHYKVELDCRQSIRDFKNTVLHELIHIEQYYEKRMIPGPAYDQTQWNGCIMSNKTKSLEEYKELPWEVEAYTRSTILFPIIFSN